MQETVPTKEDRVVFAAVLAAGRSHRFGRSKQLENFEGKPLVRRAADLAHEVCGDRSVLVAGHESAAVAAAAGRAPRYLIVNDRYADGIGGSIALTAKILSHAADAVLFLFADQPLITAHHLQALIDTWSGADDEIMATAFAGTTGPPVLFPRGAFEALGELSGDEGAKSVLRDPRFDVRTVPFEDAAVDIDTPTDLEKLAD
ncbi:MAG: nucleotidyltransferase family protein [Gammaproteobacteria bacterium]|jgi:molybdenum cofactor cytidylyltransferase|nr:nucleotidyltransferase family protein [Gammaproteobacteria bacterium]MDH3848232.1 nucleotidyltransferase family protein [Gammaproteobacteria bacterium]MDH3862613.1 nucleotidyltransferase family protein [Gammaproteobacteria bacterium]MDH3904185.1 nucleotidyltransferase family protein [Gammaproteobacteria bacterium]MDH3908369.1 nucleotidyltransferase family protein [Gammaproteobacteria bacterium]